MATMKQLYALLLLLGLTGIISAQCPITRIVTLDSIAIRSLNSNPVEIIAQPPSGNYNQVERIEIVYQAGTVKYLGDPMLTFYYNGAAQGSLYSQQLYGLTPMAAATPQLNEQLVAPNASVLVTIDSNRTKGNDKVVIYVTYRVVSLTNPTECIIDTNANPATVGGLCYEVVHVTAAQVVTLFSNPPTMLPAPPANKYIKVLGADVKRYGGVAYQNGTVLLLYFSDSTKPIGINANALPTGVANKYEFSVGANQGLVETAFPLKLGAQIQNPQLGSGDLDIIITYKILDETQGNCSGGGLLENIKDTVIDLTLDTVILSLNKNNIIVAQGTCTNIVYVFPQGNDGDVINITTTQFIINAIPIGSGINSITPLRAGLLTKDTEVTFKCVNGAWY